MNQRIKQLAKQTGYIWHASGDPQIYEFTPEKLEKFAELIVGECLEACSRANEIRHFVPPTQEQVVLSCMREIEEHFGVKE